MVIRTRKELEFYLCADRMMNRGVFHYSIKHKIRNLFFSDHIMAYLECMRYLSYYRYKNSPLAIWYSVKYRKLGLKLGFSIGYNSFGYGLVIPHFGTIVVGGSNRIGNYAVLHTSICITDNGKTIGNALYAGTGCKITTKIQLGDNCSIGANSLVNKSFKEGNVLIGGMPAKIIKQAEAWYIRDGLSFLQKVKQVESLRKKMNL